MRLILLTVLFVLAPATLACATPTASYTFAPGDPYTGEQVTFNASASVCDRTPCTYSWQDDGPDGSGGTNWQLGTGRTLTFTFANPGVKRVRLTVRNSLRQSASTVKAISVAQGPRPAPTATPTPSPTVTPAPTATPTATPTPDPTPDPTPEPSGCDRNATPATFSSEVTAATAGQTVCLSTGSYGTWTGTSKPITVQAAIGAAPVMQINFSTGDSGFTLDGMRGMGGTVSGGASQITVRDSTFTAPLTITGTAATAGLVFDGNSHNNISGATTCCRFLVDGNGVTVRRSHFEGGGADGLRVGSTTGVLVEDNVFLNIRDDGSANHTDMIQWYGGSGATVRRNLFKQTIAGETQVVAAYDGTSGNVIEDNVIDVTGRQWCIELYSGDGDVIRHNTCVRRGSTGVIDLNAKTVDDDGRNIRVLDNIATTISVNRTSLAELHHNLVQFGADSGDLTGVPVFVGGANPSTYAGYRLAPGSPGAGAASDGLDVGIR